MSCSFAGGCDFEVNLNGLSSSVLAGQASITICGETCKIDEDFSDYAVTHCSLPPLATTFSIEEYKVQETHDLDGTWFSTNSASTFAIHDGENTIGYEDSNTECHVGVQMMTGHVGIVS
mmetsp:Transcript_44479/g.32600  ORF Transcript_44479/g.32600 Transcript_44479/m.32600 type:complete len:119 (+) Transcript_44479:1912-2268(+)